MLLLHYFFSVLLPASDKSIEKAIEATQLVHNAMDRWIKLQISNIKLFIHAENSCPNISEQSRTYPLKNRNFHGLGLSNVQLAAEKYGGHMKAIFSRPGLKTCG
ncbi:GHKL domain-containing protein [Paenibacillus sp. 22594]|uniref:GHKL domain-containing protein n=1 Tax=Paenibacillus sp. 22594 TaxID=3453947 RepID=UPI003F871EB8